MPMTEEITVAENIDQVGEQTLKAIAGAEKFNRWTYDTIRPYLKGKILEIGSGIGNISAFARLEHQSITLSDINPTYQEYLLKKFQGSVKNVLSIDLMDPSFTEQFSVLKESFDSIFLLNVIEHLADEKMAIENCNYLLKKNGNLCAGTSLS